MRRILSTLALPLVVLIGVLVMTTVYIIDVRQTALVLRFGEVVSIRTEPGLGLKVPFVDRVVKYDARILGLPTEPMEVTPADDRRIVVDAFARWQITDAVRFRRAVGGGGVEFAQQRLGGILTNAIRGVLGSVPSTQVLSNDRTALMNRIRDAARTEAEALGVTIIDVRLTRTDLPTQNLAATYARMRAEREREAADERARGGEAAQRVRATADRTVVELTSDARRRAEVVRGEADAARNAIYAGAFGRDPEFFAFTRSMTAYENALRGDTSSIVMQPDGEFFSYLRDDRGGQTGALPVAAPSPAEAPAAPDAAAPSASGEAEAPAVATGSVAPAPDPAPAAAAAAAPAPGASAEAAAPAADVAPAPAPAVVTPAPTPAPPTPTPPAAN